MPGSVVRVALAAGALLLFAGIGVAHLVNPDWFVKRSSLRRGGEMLREWNRLQTQILGVILIAASAYGLYQLFFG